MNMLTHIVGGALGIVVCVLCVIRSVLAGSVLSVVGSAVYGGTMITLYAISSVYHALVPCTGKKVMQVLDHCAIYFLISGTYTPILLTAFVPVYPTIGWGLLVFQWGLTALAVTLTAIDLHRYRIVSMVCYILMGWSILFFLPQTLQLIGKAGFGFLLTGGITYTIGAILYGIGAKRRWFHCIFHIFVVLGSFFQFVAIYFYIL